MSGQPQHVAIVGGTSGIGRAAAELFAQRGYRVSIGGRDRQRLDTAAGGLGVAGVQVDGTSSPSARAFFETIGSVDHLVLALSGGVGAGAFRSLSLDDVRTGFEAKFWAHSQWNLGRCASMRCHPASSTRRGGIGCRRRTLSSRQRQRPSRFIVSANRTMWPARS